jgi:hypothetical protein
MDADKGGAGVALHLGGAKQTVVLGPLFVLDFGPNYDPATGDDGQVERLSPHVLDERRQVLAQIGQGLLVDHLAVLDLGVGLADQHLAERPVFGRDLAQRLAQGVLGADRAGDARRGADDAGGLARRAEGEPREAQSMAFFSTPVTPPLYSGQASSRASAERTASFQALTGSGSPWSSTSWLNSGRSCRPKISIVTPSGAHSWAARSRAVLNEAARRLPETPRSFMYKAPPMERRT